jgi:hypothetical protein
MLGRKPVSAGKEELSLVMFRQSLEKTGGPGGTATREGKQCLTKEWQIISCIEIYKLSLRMFATSRITGGRAPKSALPKFLICTRDAYS